MARISDIRKPTLWRRRPSHRSPKPPLCIPKKTHKREVQAIRELIRLYGGVAYLLHQSSRLHGSAGLPDMFCMLDDHAFWIEVKASPRDYLRTAQSAFIERAHQCGQTVIVGGLDHVKKWIETWR